MLNGIVRSSAGGTPALHRPTWRLGLIAAGCGVVYAQIFYRFHLWEHGTVVPLVLLASALTAGMTCLLVRRAHDGLTVVRLLLAGVVGIVLGALVDVAAHPIAESGGERNLFPFEIALLTLFGLPGALLGSILGWMARPRAPQPPAP